jgi:hypothetical protein
MLIADSFQEMLATPFGSISKFNMIHPVVRIEENKPLYMAIYVPFNTSSIHQIILTLHISVFRPSSDI